MKLNFNELVIFLDISDIPDEFYYNKNFDNDHIKKFNLRDYLQELLIQNISTYLFIDIILEKINILKENIILRYKTSQEFKLSFYKTTHKDMNLFKSINVERGNWTRDNKSWNLHGKKGRKLATFYLNQLYNLCKDNNIKLSLVIYPWPSQIYYAHNTSIHRNYWNNWSRSKNVYFIDLFKYFENDQPKITIEKFFIDGDIHWNKEGHLYIYDKFMSEYPK